MLVDSLYESEFEGTIFGDAIDRSIRNVEPDRAVAGPLAFERFVVPAVRLARFLEPNRLDRANPCHELADDLSWTRLEIPLGVCREGNGTNHQARLSPSWVLSTPEIDAASGAGARRAAGSKLLWVRRRRRSLPVVDVKTLLR